MTLFWSADLTDAELVVGDDAEEAGATMRTEEETSMGVICDASEHAVPMVIPEDWGASEPSSSVLAAQNPSLDKLSKLVT